MSDLSGLALVITSILTPISVVAVGWFTNRKVGQVASTAEETLVQARAVNHAVNGKDPRETTLSEDVIKIRDKQETDQPSAKTPGLVPRFDLFEKLLEQLAEGMKELREANGVTKGGK